MSDKLPRQDHEIDDLPAELSALSESQQSKLTELLDDYLSRLENGDCVAPAELTADHPELRTVFACYVVKLKAIHGIAGEIPSPASSDLGMIQDSTGVCRLGDYEIIRELGRGGMGTVYEARQTVLDRSVALKLLPMTATFDSRQVARFQNEANAAGQLNHPHIVPIYSVGASRRIHYYAMQLIDGQSMDQWIDGQPNPGDVDWKQAIEWTIQIAGALQCAHESGIVHRDVKPSNLLLDRTGRIWITDFGLASCQSSVALTQSGDMLGTLRYMSPEQAGGRREQVDYRTDIYSLAATLFEILTLQPAVLGEDGATLLRQLEHDEPRSVTNLRRDLPGDLGIVLQTAMARCKDDRYESADQFADDLQAVLDNRPTLAQPPSAVKLVQRFAGRHRKVMVAAAGMLAVVFFLLSVSSLIIWQQNQDIRGHQARADRNFDRARTTVDELGTTVAQRLAAVPGAEHVRKKLLQDTLDYYQQFIAEATGDRQLPAEIAKTHTNVGCLIAELEDPAKAIPHFQRAAECFADLPSVDTNDPEIKRLIAHNANHLGLALAADGQVDQSRELYDQAIALQTELVQTQPPATELSIELATMQNNLGLLYRQLGQQAQARRLFSRTIARLTQLDVGGESEELRSRSLSAALSNLSSLTMELEPQQSALLLQEAIAQRLGSIDQSPNRFQASAEIATMHGNLGSAKLSLGDLAGASAAFESAIDLQRQLHVLVPNVQSHQRDLAMSLNNLAMIKQRQSRPHEAAPLLAEAVTLQQALIASSSSATDLMRLGAIEHNYAIALTGLKGDRRAIQLLQRAIEHQKSAWSTSTDQKSSAAYLRKHYLALLRLYVRRGQWTQMRATEAALRATAEGDRHILDRLELQIRAARKQQTRNQPKSVAMVRP